MNIDIDDPLLFLTRPAHEASEHIRLMNSAEREVVMAAIKSRLDRAEQTVDSSHHEEAIFEAGQMEIRLRIVEPAVAVWNACADIPLSDIVNGIETYVATGVLPETVGGLR